jgi:TetR/AcrR family transcriptional regulator, transcriptional repressor of bet genes
MSTGAKRKTPIKKLTHPRESPEERRLSLALAAIRSAAKHGTQGLSVRFIAREAGVSQSLITYHFGENEELIVLAYDVLMDRFYNSLITAIDAVDGEEAKLHALIDACTSPIEYNTDSLATSIVFWGQILHSPRMRTKFQRQNEKHIELTSALLSKFVEKEGIEVEDLRLSAVSLFAMLDGLWLTWVLNPDSFNADDARNLGRKWLRAFRTGAHGH